MDPNQPVQQKAHFAPILGMIGLFILGGFLGIVMDKLLFTTKSTGNSVQSSIVQQQVPSSDQAVIDRSANSIFDKAYATIIGTVTNINGTTLTISSDKGKTSDFSLAQSFTISNPSVTPPNSSDISAINTSQEGVITLEMQGDKYVVTSIAYYPKAGIVVSLPSPTGPIPTLPKATVIPQPKP